MIFQKRKCSPVQLALSNRKGPATIIENPFNQGGNTLQDGFADSMMEELGEAARWLVNQAVMTNTLDNFVTQHKVKQINFIKIDVEGHEIPVLEGCAAVIKEYTPVIYVEVSSEENYHKIASMLPLQYKPYDPVSHQIVNDDTIPSDVVFWIHYPFVDT